MRELLESLEGAPADELLIGLAYVAGRGAVLDDPDLAWRAFACAMLAEQLADE